MDHEDNQVSLKTKGKFKARINERDVSDYQYKKKCEWST